MIVPSTCAACGKAGKFIEFKAEPCTPGAARSISEGEDERGTFVREGERRYGFRCLACKDIVPELVAQDGRKHYWSEGKHLEA